MKPYYQDNHITNYNMDFRENDLPDESIQCVVTSPPYWGLRKYSGEQELIWGGDKDCQHEWGEAETKEMNYVQGNPEFARPHREHKNFVSTTNTCSLCGAWKGAYGLEPTPEMYIEHTIQILREIRRVLRKDGVVFWNIGDSYMSGGGPTRHYGWADPKNLARGIQDYPEPTAYPHKLIKPKDLCLIPFRVAIAAQEDGWWVRSDIIWSKPNPMPESVTDRPTNSHEHILMLTKSGTTQYWTHRDHEGTRKQPKPDYRWVKEDVEVSEMPNGWTPKNKMGWDRINLWKGHDYYWDADAVREPHTTEFRPTRPETSHGKEPTPSGQSNNLTYNKMHPAGRNIRSVWEFPTQPYPEAHFAVFPEKLPEICIKAATPEVGCCSKCGAPWERISESKKGFTDGKCNVCGQPRNKHIQSAKSGMRNSTVILEDGAIACSGSKTLGWQQGCKCNADKVPSIVLDPFGGAGTTPWVAKKLNRRCYVYEISEEYCELIVNRTRQQGLI